MNRRTVLRTLGGSTLTVGTAGCLGRQLSGSASDRHTTTSSETLRIVRVVDSDATPDEVDATLAATVRRADVTSEHTAMLRVEFTNRTEASATYTFGDYPPFTAFRSVESDPGVLLLDPDRTYERPSPTCWRPSNSPSLGADGLAKQVALDSEESVHRDVELWGTPEQSGEACLPTGTFRFENRYDFEGTDPFVWGFSVEIVAP